jgi:hypothetical protein
MITDLSIMRDRLRKETAELLGLDIDDLTATQSIRLDRAATLRLELDDIESRKLQGATFDAVKYIAVSEALERMLGGQPEQPSSDRDLFAGARDELERFLVARAQRIEARDQNRDAALREENARLTEENEKLKAELRARPRAPQPNNVVAIDATARANANRPPDHYIAEHQRRREPWQQGGASFTVPSWPLPR